MMKIAKPLSEGFFGYSAGFLRYTGCAMATSRRLILFSWLLVVILALGSAMPPLALWQCRHASRVISAAAPLSAMPCRTSLMPMGEMPRMACCPLETAAPTVTAHSAVTRPACHPALTRLVALPPASVSETHTHLHQSLVAAFLALPQTALFLPSFPAILPLRQRPPPSLGFCQSALKHVPGLRAPPAA